MELDFSPWAMLLPPLEKIEPMEPLDKFSDDGIRVEKESLLDVKSGLSSDDDEDGAKVAIEIPTG